MIAVWCLCDIEAKYGEMKIQKKKEIDNKATGKGKSKDKYKILKKGRRLHKAPSEPCDRI